MASMTAAEVTYTQTFAGISGPGRTRRQFLLTFPTGANEATNNQYVAGGVPLDKGKLGCPRILYSLKVLGRTPTTGALNPLWEWNGSQTTPTLLAFETNTAGSPGVEMSAEAFSADATVYVEVEGY